MLATLAGFLALLLGLSLLLLPLLVTELSRPRDSAWGAVVLLLGLVLVTSAERLTGAPMLAVLCGGLLVGRLGSEVAQGRWRALSDEERLALRSAERWSRSLNQLTAAAASLLQSSLALAGAGSAWLAERRQGRSHGKRWVRSEAPGEAVAAAAAQPAPAAGSGGPLGGEAEPAASQPEAARAEAAAPAAAVPPADASGEDSAAAAAPDPGVRVVSDFAGVDALLAAAPQPEAPAPSPQTSPAAGDAPLPAPQA